MPPDDLKSCAAGDWIVCGWFTPNYRSLAEKFAANLAQYDAAFHLWAKQMPTPAWNALAKPSVVLQTMDAYPSKTVILMDVDCTICGEIAPITSFTGDVSLTIKARHVRLVRGFQKRITFKTSSRVVVFHPTDGAKAFATDWERLCKASSCADADETNMAWVYLSRPDICYHHLDPRYAGDEVGNTVAGAVISHYGAHGRTKGPALKNFLKNIERRWFRTGRTQVAKRAWRQAEPCGRPR
jgi:hypothetical protein